MNLSKRETILIILLMVLISMGSYLNFYLVPKINQITSLRSTISEKSAEIDLAVMRTVQYGALTAKRNNIMLDWNNIIAPIPSSFDNADVLFRIQQAIILYTNDISVRFQGDSEVLEHTRIRTVDIGFTVTYNQLQSILETFSAKSVSNRILDLNYTMVNEVDSLLNVNILVEFHVFN